jgi:hypothetical protein
MRIREVTKLATPQQQRVQQLKSQLDVARRAAKLARLNQQQQRVNQQRAKLNRVGS